MLKLDDGDKDIEGLSYINDNEGEYSIVWEIIDSFYAALELKSKYA